ncbi:MAG: glycosyl hydrolase [Blastocatellia bacterium]|nr:glycosyl hydrolase [Blastocatellia bacterium]
MKLLNFVLLFLFVTSPYVGLLQAHPQETPENKEKTDEKEKKPADPMSSGTFAGLKLRSIGPALTSGRVVDFAVHPNDRSQYYVAAAAGGVWKTTNSGNTWMPVFENEGSHSIGTVVLDPKNPATVWVGTGEDNNQRSVGYGDGIYRSDDGGKSWKNMGLKKSEHIGKIVIDPRNSNTVYVAAEGPLWGPGGDRGLYKTTDGGKTWKATLTISENTGVCDVVQDWQNPDVLYAAAHQRRRHVYTIIHGGPESALYKSTDGGETWNKLKSGLPTTPMGRIGLAMSQQDSKMVYAIIESIDKKGGIFRTTDSGATWERRNEFDQQAQYYSHLFVDPKNHDRIYVMNVLIRVSDDGGKTLRVLGEKWKHVDNHVIWVDPNNTNYYLVGCDGGIYESFDRGVNWSYKSNLPITQFYDVAVDNSQPFYYVYGGTQDNESLGGPSRTTTANGIRNADWFVTQGGDGFHQQVDPEDPNIVYSEYQYGGLTRYDRRTGERTGIKPMEGKGEPSLKWNWDSPLIISPHSHTRLYFAANKLFRSDDRGDSWKPVSPDLTRQLDRNTLPVMGKVWGVDAVFKHGSTSLFGNITALAESPKKEGLLFVGTDDGLLQISENGGESWRKIEKFAGVPDMTYVSRLLPSQHDANTIYATFDNHKNSDFTPYVLKSTDLGKSWTSLKADLPANGPALAIAEDHVNPNLLFVGTEFGLYFTLNGGQKWIQLKGNFPTIAVRDLAIQKRENDLVVATFGRGFYILDDYTPLRTVKPETLQQESALFAVKDALLYIQGRPLGGGGKASQGEALYLAENAPFGATFTYYLKEELKTKKKLRQEAEKEAEKKKTQAPYPTFDQLREETDEPAPAIMLTIQDESGRVVRRLNGANSAGMNRVTWNLRSPGTVLSPAAPEEGDDDDGGPDGPLVLPGTYKVSLAKRVSGVWSQLAGPQTFTVKALGVESMAAADRAALVEFQQKVARLYGAFTGTLETANQTKRRLDAIKKAIHDAPAVDYKLLDQALALEKRLTAIQRALRGDEVIAGRNENAPKSIADRVGQILEEERLSTARPTQTHRQQFAIASEELTTQLSALRQLVEVDVKNLEKALDAAGAPWTPGRIPEWNEK